METRTIAMVIGAGSALLLCLMSLIALIIHVIRNSSVTIGEMDQRKIRNFGSSSRRSSSGDELHPAKKKKRSSLGLRLSFSSTSTKEFAEDVDPYLIPASKSIQVMAMGPVYSKLRNGDRDSDQRCETPPEKNPARRPDPAHLLLSMPPITSTPGTPDGYWDVLFNYATLSGRKPEVFGVMAEKQVAVNLKSENESSRKAQKSSARMSPHSTDCHREKSSPMTVNIEATLLYPPLVSKQYRQTSV